MERDIFCILSNISDVGLCVDLTTEIENNKWNHLALFVGFGSFHFDQLP